MAQSYWREKFNTLRSPKSPPLAPVQYPEERAAFDITHESDKQSGTDIFKYNDEVEYVPGSEFIPPPVRTRSRSLESYSTDSLPSTHSRYSPRTGRHSIPSPSFGTLTGVETVEVGRERRGRTMSPPIRHTSTADIADVVYPEIQLPARITAADLPVSQSKTQLPSLLEEKTWSEEQKRVVPNLSHPEMEELHVPNYSAPLSSLEAIENPNDPGIHARMEAFAVSNPYLPTTDAQKAEASSSPGIDAKITTSVSHTSDHLTEEHGSKPPFFFFFNPSQHASDDKPKVAQDPAVHRRSQSAGIGSVEMEHLNKEWRSNQWAVGGTDTSHNFDKKGGTSWTTVSEYLARMK